METVRVLLVDDSPEFLEVAADYLSMDPEIKVVGCACSGLDGLRRVAELRPDLVLMDVTMPGMNGLEATRAIKAKESPPRVLILTLYDIPEYRAAAASAGADGFLNKSDFGERLLPLIHSLLAEPASGGKTGQVEKMDRRPM